MKMTEARSATVYAESRHHHEGEPRYEAVVKVPHKHGVAGATAVRGHEGYGSHEKPYHSHRFDLFENVPVVIMLTDIAARVDAVLPTISAMLGGRGLLAVCDVLVRQSGASQIWEGTS